MVESLKVKVLIQVLRPSSSIMSSRTKLVAYLPSLRTILQRLRATSTVPIISLDTKYVSDCSYSTEERAAAILDRMATKDVHEGL